MWTAAMRFLPSWNKIDLTEKLIQYDYNMELSENILLVCTQSTRSHDQYDTMTVTTIDETAKTAVRG